MARKNNPHLKAGSDQASLRKPLNPAHVVGLIVLGLLGLWLWGLAQQFNPSSAWFDLAWKISLELTLLCIGYLFWGWVNERIDFNESVDGDTIVAVIIMPFIVFFMGWHGIAHGAGDLLNRAFGKVESAEIRFQTGAYNAEDGCLKVLGFVAGSRKQEDFCLVAADVPVLGLTLPPRFSATITARRSRFGALPFILNPVVPLPSDAPLVIAAAKPPVMQEKPP